MGSAWYHPFSLSRGGAETCVPEILPPKQPRRVSGDVVGTERRCCYQFRTRMPCSYNSCTRTERTNVCMVRNTSMLFVRMYVRDWKQKWKTTSSLLTWQRGGSVMMRSLFVRVPMNIRVRMCVRMRKWVCLCVHICVRACLYLIYFVPVCVYVHRNKFTIYTFNPQTYYMYVCTCICMYTCTRSVTHTYTHQQIKYHVYDMYILVYIYVCT